MIQDDNKRPLGTFGQTLSAAPKSVDQKIKRGAAVIASNIATVGLIAAAGIIIATTWLDINLATILNFRFATDAVLTVILYCFVQIIYTDKGVIMGKQDPEYIDARTNYLAIRDTITKMGSPYINDFCYDFVDSRLKRRRVAYLAKHCNGLSYDEWDNTFRGMDKHELRQYQKAHRKDKGSFKLEVKHIPFILYVNNMSAMNLTPEMLLLEEVDNWTNEALSPSPLMVLKRKRNRAIVGSVLSAFFVVSIVFTIGANPTWAGLVYMFLKLFFLAQRAFRGYSDGCLAYSVAGVTYHTDQRNKCEEYLYSWLPIKRARVEHEQEHIEVIKATEGTA